MPRTTLTILVALALAAGPADAGPLTIHPGRVELGPADDRHGLLVTADAADVTDRVTWESSDPAVAKVVAGEVVAAGPGRATLTARHAGAAAVEVVVAPRAAGRAPSFLNEIEPLLTRQGCNQGACHGKGSGQNGFRLSLRGYAPEADHAWLTREYGGRRQAAVPADSLLLRKPTGAAPHEGGKLFGRDSRAYRLLHDWLAAGSPGPDPADPVLVALELLPGPRTLAVGQSQRLLAVARFADGGRRDVTWLTKFDSNDPGTAEVTPGGLLRARREGETAVRAAFLGQVAVAVVTVPYDRPPPPPAPAHNVIDRHVFAKLAQLRIPASDLCTDAEFARRASLDATGRLPTPEAVREFLADARPDKRVRYIDRLLESPDYVDYWTLVLADLLQNRKERDHDVRGPKNVRAFHAWLRAKVAANRPWDEIAREVLTAAGRADRNPAVGYYVVTVGESREPERSEVVASVAQAFLGTRIGCAQCHNHPLEKYTQDDYYHFAGFFSRVRFERKDPHEGPTKLVVSHPDPNRNREPVGAHQPRTGKMLPPRPLDRSAAAVAPGDDPRAALASWMTDPGNEYFRGAMVNRLWKHFLGVGLVEPVDDLRATNPPSNPGLWAELTSEFAKSKFDLKHVVRLVMNSRTYQLSSATRPENAAESRFYSHYYARRLPAEVLLDAVGEATGVPDRFPGYPVGVRAVQLPDPGLGSYFLSLFGRSNRVTACACERSGEVTMPQLLHLLNGDTLAAKLRDPAGRLARLLKDKVPDDRLVDELFLAALARPATAAERAAVAGQLAEGGDRDEVYRDLFWAIVNSKDFAFNH